MDILSQFIRKWRYDGSEPKEIVVELANNLQKPSLVLDIGCGRGRHLSYLREHGCLLVATDISSDAINYCKYKSRKDKKKIYFVWNNMANLCFKDKIFDAVIATNSLHHSNIIGIKKTINEIYRVLKPYSWFAASVASTSIAFRNGIEIEKNTFIRESQGKAVMQHFFTEKEIKELFRRFKIIKLYETRESKEESAGHWHILAQKRI